MRTGDTPRVSSVVPANQLSPFLPLPTLPGMAFTILALPPTRTELIPRFLLSCSFALSFAMSTPVLPPSACLAIPNHF